MNSFFLAGDNGIAFDNPRYILEEGINVSREREIETVLAISNGFIGTRNNLEEYYKICDTATFIAGVYEKTDPDSEFNILVKVPDWTRIIVYVDDEPLDLFQDKLLSLKRYIDLKYGIAVREWRSQDYFGRITYIKIIKLISLSRKHEALKSVIIQPENYSGKVKVISGIDGSFTEGSIFSEPEIISDENLITLGMKTRYSEKLIAISQKSDFLGGNTNNIVYDQEYLDKKAYEQWEWHADISKYYTVNSMVSIYSNIETKDPVNTSREHFRNLECDYERRFQEHVEEWQKHWNNAEIIILGDLHAQKWINFAIYHLIAAGNCSGDYFSIPARGLTGEAYKGHVFWDTEIYLLPFYLFTEPKIARALLMYRYNTLDGARKNALKEEFKGACYAWESTDSGIEMAPDHAILPFGEIIEIKSGRYENHISPDIAYAVWQYWQATHDEDFLVNYGAEIIFETARFCESLITKQDHGLYHIYNVIGPDEYHENIDDNAYTNYLTQHNIDIAIKTAEILNTKYKDQYEKLKKKINLSDQEIERWNIIKEKIYISYDKSCKVYEQFKGYFDLEDIDLKQYESRTAPMDIILGRERVEKSQIVKQPDVVMFLFLLANKFSKEIVKANYDYYEPRTGHGSSLSPSIYSIVAARLGKLEQAYKYFEQNASIDLNDNMGNAALGIHIASMGGLWMNIVMGFAGMYIYEQGLLFDPNLPEQWYMIRFTIHWRGQKVNIQLFKDEMILRTIGEQKILISMGLENWKELAPDIKYSAYESNGKWFWR